MTKYSWQNLVISFFLIPSLSSFTGIAETPPKAVNSVNPTNISQSIVIAQILPQILPNNAGPDGYQLQPQLIVGFKANSTSSIVSDLIDRMEGIVNKETLKIINKGEGGDGTECGIDTNGQSVCGAFQFTTSTFAAWSRGDIYSYIDQIKAADDVISAGHLCLFGTAWETAPNTGWTDKQKQIHYNRIIKPLKKIYSNYRCRSTQQLVFPNAPD